MSSIVRNNESVSSDAVDIDFLRKLVVLNGLVPLAILAWDAIKHQLGANEVSSALHITGTVSLVFLFLSLTVTPLRVLFGWSSLIAYRRSLGLYGFFYSIVHVCIYVGFDRALNVASTFDELFRRRFLQVGLVAVLLMIPLAATSTDTMIRRLGPKRWKLLHRSAYLVAILGVVHYYMLVKSDVRQPLMFAAVLTILLGFRPVNHYIDLRKKAYKSAAIKKSANTSIRPKFWKGKLRLARIFRETQAVKTFRFHSEDGGELPFKFKAGQYLNLCFSINGMQLRRSYTISSSPCCLSYCEISVKCEEQGVVSKHVHDELQVGVQVEISAPAGRFVFNSDKHSAVTLIAGGVGITPIMSIARDLCDRSWYGGIYFIFVTRSQTEIIFRSELEHLASRFPNFHLLISLTAIETDVTWKGHRGRLDQHVLNEFVPTILHQPAFVCGPTGMMNATCDLLRQIGVQENFIVTEEFASPIQRDVDPEFSQRDILPNEVANKPTDAVVKFASSQVVTDVEADMTLLEAAEAVGIEILFECRSGICGQCKVKCLEGKVFMATRDALTANEETQGWILACQATPRSTEITIDA